jgi:hypothetical protein
MTIFQYALLREASRRMTPEELNIAKELAEAAEKKVPGALEALSALMNEVLFHSRRPAPKDPPPPGKPLAQYSIE